MTEFSTLIDTLITIGRLILVAVCFGLASFFFLCACVSARVLVDLIRAGPAAADRAMADGASIKGWWNGTYTKRPYWLRD